MGKAQLTAGRRGAGGGRSRSQGAANSQCWPLNEVSAARKRRWWKLGQAESVYQRVLRVCARRRHPQGIADAEDLLVPWTPSPRAVVVLGDDRRAGG